MAALTLQVLTPGGTAATLTSADSEGDSAPTGSGVWLEVVNASGADVTVTIETPGMVGGLEIADREVTVPDGERRLIPLPSSMYAGADGRAAITYSAASDVSVGVFRIS